MSYAVENRRKFERFEMNVPALVALSGQQDTIRISTRDISAGGAYLLMDEPLEVGQHITIEISIPNETIRTLTGTEFNLKAQGKIVRTDDGGVAVRFNAHEIMPLGSMLDN